MLIAKVLNSDKFNVFRTVRKLMRVVEINCTNKVRGLGPCLRGGARAAAGMRAVCGAGVGRTQRRGAAGRGRGPRPGARPYHRHTVASRALRRTSPSRVTSLPANPRDASRIDTSSPVTCDL